MNLAQVRKIVELAEAALSAAVDGNWATAREKLNQAFDITEGIIPPVRLEAPNCWSLYFNLRSKVWEENGVVDLVQNIRNAAVLALHEVEHELRHDGR